MGVVRSVRCTKQHFLAVLAVKMEFLAFHPLAFRWRRWNARDSIFTARTVELFCLVLRTELITFRMTFYISFSSFKQDPTDFEIFEFWWPRNQGFQVGEFLDFGIFEMCKYRNILPKVSNSWPSPAILGDRSRVKKFRKNRKSPKIA